MKRVEREPVLEPRIKAPAARPVASRLAALAVALFALFTAVSASAQRIEFLNAAPSVYENGTNVSVVVTRVPATGAATVDFTTADGTATAGQDYQAVSGTLSFSDGETFKIITIPIIDDLLSEGTETFIVTLSNPTGAALGLSAVTVTIFDDD